MVSMKLLAVALVVSAISQTLAFPTNGATIDFSEDRNVYPANGANGQKIEFVQESNAENLEEALFTYTELLKGLNQKSGGKIQPDSDEFADDQTTALCKEPSCDCNILKRQSFEGTNTQTGEACYVVAVPHCKGACPGSFR